MTRQESFKRRVRGRMAKTGERYGATRRALIEQSSDLHAVATGTGRNWAAQPEQSDEVIRRATGRGWDEWCDVIDAWPGKDDGHSAIAAYVQEQHAIPGWWAQAVTVGFERITGRRLPHQRADGTFTAGRSATVTVEPGMLRELLLDEAGRAELFPGMETALRSRPTSKNVRLAVGPGVAEIDLAPRADGRVKVTIQHERLPEHGDVEHWKAFWGEWLAAIDDGRP